LQDLFQETELQIKQDPEIKRTVCYENNSIKANCFFYASNEPKSVLARDLGDCRDNLRNSQSVFLIVVGLKRIKAAG